MRHFLGIDGGGSKCNTVLLDETGTVLGWGTSGPTTYQCAADAESCYRKSVTDALAQTTLDEAWVGELWSGSANVAWLEKQDIRFHIESPSEHRICLTAALQDYGIAVHAGTGNFVYARTLDYRELSLGGNGPILGDEGAGWDIGLRGLKAGLRSPWTAETRTSLAKALPPALGVDDLSRVVGGPICHGEVSRARMATLAPLVIAQAEAGDRVALRVLEEAAEDLAEIVRLLLTELGIVGKGYPLIGIASVIQGSPFYWRILRDKILLHDSTLAPTVPPVRMCVGAAFEVMRRAGVPITLKLRDRVVATQRRFAGADVVTST